MNSRHIARFLHLRSTSGLASRRVIVASLASGLMAAGIVGNSVHDVEGRKKGKRRKNRRKQRNDRKPRTRADATCPGPADFGLNDPAGNVRFAQTFTAQASGSLVSAELQLSKQAGSDGDYILRLSPVDGAGVPTNEVLAETSAANVDVPEGSPFVRFTFAKPASVKAGVDYALVMTRTAGDVGWNARGSNSCAGTAFQSQGQEAFRAVGANDDFIFTAFVRS